MVAAANPFAAWSTSELVNKLMGHPTLAVARELISRVGADNAKALVTIEREVRNMERRGEDVGPHVEKMIAHFSR